MPPDMHGPQAGCTYQRCALGYPELCPFVKSPSTNAARIAQSLRHLDAEAKADLLDQLAELLRSILEHNSAPGPES